jgi:hypothetical protein
MQISCDIDCDLGDSILTEDKPAQHRTHAYIKVLKNITEMCPWTTEHIVSRSFIFILVVSDYKEYNFNKFPQ